MTITLRQKDLENDNKSLYLDIYENGKRKFEFLSLYLIPEINQETKERNEATLKRAQEIRAERVLHPETIPEKGHLMVVPDIPNDDSPEVIDWIQTYMEWMDGNPEYSKRTVEQNQYLQERMKEFLKAKRRPHITLMKFDKTWFKAFFLWLKNDYVPQKYVRVKANPFYQLEKEDTISKPNSGHKLYLTPDELKLFMASEEANGVRETQLAFGFACLTGLRISDIRALRWSNIMRNEVTNTLVIVQKKTKELNAVPICSTAEAWMPPKKDDKVFHLPAHANVDAALKRIAKKVGITKTISFHTSRHTFGTVIQAATGDIETTKKLMGHKSLKSTAVYADVLTEEKVKAISNTKTVFRSRKPHTENKKIPRTKRTAATNTHPRKVIDIQDNE